MNTALTLATRNSPLALWQARHVASQLQARGYLVRLLPMTTQGDQILDKALFEVGGKGLFIKELEHALQEGKADIAVHSLKDIPMALPNGFALAAVMEREDPRDAWVSPRYAHWSELPLHARVGTASLRRQAFLKSLAQSREQNWEMLSLRGNLQTRLAKLDEGLFDGIVLATAGLKRLGLHTRIASQFEINEILPAPGQGALGLEVCADRHDLIDLVKTLNHHPTHIATTAERALSLAMGGNCSMPLAAFAQWDATGQSLCLQAAWARLDACGLPSSFLTQCQATCHHPTEENARQLGQALAKTLQGQIMKEDGQFAPPACVA
jgi:hydroxymethylbilane synthase